MDVNVRNLSDQQIQTAQLSDDERIREQARREEDRRIDSRRFWRSFFFPNLWAVLGLLVALYAAISKHQP